MTLVRLMTFRSAIFASLRQDVVLHAIDERGVFFLLAQIFKRQNGDSVCYRMSNKFTFPNDPSRSCRQSDEGRCKQRAGWIAPHPFSSTRLRFQCAALRSAHALANVPNLRPAREQKSTDALDLSRDTSGRLLRGRDRFLDLTTRGCRGSVSSSNWMVS